MRVKTPIIIKEVLGEEAYNMMEEFSIENYNFKQDNNIHLYMGIHLWEEFQNILKKEYKNGKKDRKRRINKE